MTHSLGTIDHDGRAFLIEAEPHVALVLKRVFAKLSKGAHGIMRLSDNPDTCRDLEWVLQRYPLDVRATAARRMRAGAQAHRERMTVVEALLAGKSAPRPFSLAVPLRQYQQVAAEIALRTGGLLLADEVGVGKTASAIGMISDPRARPALVVTLSHLTSQWQSEVRRFAPGLRTHVLSRSTPYDLTAPKVRGRRQSYGEQLPLIRDLPDVIITSYHKLDGWAQTLAPVIQSVVYDEAQELRRGTKSAKGNAALFLAQAASFRLSLSATPIYNYGGEIWNVLEATRPGAMGEWEEFSREWCSATGSGLGVRDPRALGAYLRAQGLMLRRTRGDVGRELPAVSSVPVPVASDSRQFDAIRGDATALARILLDEGEAKKGAKMQAAGELDMRLRQATGLAKAPFVADFVRLLVESDQQVVLFGWHRAVYSVWMDALASLQPVLYTGSESPREKDAARERFMAGQARVLIMSLRSGAGLDGLQGVCSTVVFGELDWSPAVHHQCVGRVARDGQTKPVMAYYLLSDEGSDPVVSDVLGVKTGQLAGIRDDADVEPLDQAPGDRVRELARAFLSGRKAS